MLTFILYYIISVLIVAGFFAVFCEGFGEHLKTDKNFKIGFYVASIISPLGTIIIILLVLDTIYKTFTDKGTNDE